MTGHGRPLGSAALVGGLCAAVLFGLSLTMSTAQMTGVAHSERGPSTIATTTSTAAATPTPSADAEPTEVVAAPRGSVRRLPAAPLAAVPAPQPVVSGVVRQGAFCARAAVAQIGRTSTGTDMICSYGDGEDQPRWRAIAVPQAAPKTTKPPAAESTDDDQPDGESTDDPADDEPTTVKPSKPPTSTTPAEPSENSEPFVAAS
jgi:hypothetical protein